jgi:hypothetical protein
MRAAGLRAPLAHHTPETIAANGSCFELRTGEGVGVFVVRQFNGVLWIDGAGSYSGAGLTEAGLALFDALAVQLGCKTIAFETVRPGLVRKSKKAGFEVAGYTMKKAVA